MTYIKYIFIILVALVCIALVPYPFNSTSNNTTNTNISLEVNDIQFNPKDVTPIPCYQYEEGYAAGCEVAALVADLRIYGYEVDIEDIAENYLSYGNQIDDYHGDIHTTGWCFPAAITATANSFLYSNNSFLQNLTATNISQCSWEDYLNYLDKAPIITWFTVDYDIPHWYSDSNMWWNEHCILVYEADDNFVYVVDSIQGYQKIPTPTFKNIWQLCGSYAVIIY
jgi:uncharacterized protein YvpB